MMNALKISPSKFPNISFQSFSSILLLSICFFKMSRILSRVYLAFFYSIWGFYLRRISQPGVYLAQNHSICTFFKLFLYFARSQQHLFKNFSFDLGLFLKLFLVIWSFFVHSSYHFIQFTILFTHQIPHTHPHYHQ